MSILIVGYGNALCGDDGLGQEIAERLQEVFMKTDSEKLEILTMHQLDVVLSERISHFRRVMFIDAQTQLYQQPIVIQQLQPSEKQHSNNVVPFSAHHLHPLEILDLAHRLYNSSPEAWLIAVQGYQMELGAPISQAALQNAQLAVSAVCDLLAGFNILPN